MNFLIKKKEKRKFDKNKGVKTKIKDMKTNKYKWWINVQGVPDLIQVKLCQYVWKKLLQGGDFMWKNKSKIKNKIFSFEVLFLSKSVLNFPRVHLTIGVRE